jgi:long-subunit fatty acid transport protein
VKTVFVFAIALAIGTYAGTALGSKSQRTAPVGTAGRGGDGATNTAEAAANNAAYRDGLYQAKLAVERGSGVHIARGRWASDEDRAAFVAGYQQGLRATRG